MSDPFDLEQFITAQEPVFDTALKELKAGQKRTHWTWFVFPQLRDLGRASTAKFYGIGSLEEARLSRLSVPGPALDPVRQDGAGKRCAVAASDIWLAR